MRLLRLALLIVAMVWSTSSLAQDSGWLLVMPKDDQVLIAGTLRPGASVDQFQRVAPFASHERCTAALNTYGRAALAWANAENTIWEAVKSDNSSRIYGPDGKQYNKEWVDVERRADARILEAQGRFFQLKFATCVPNTR